MLRRMRNGAPILMLIAAALTGAPAIAQAIPHRVASINLCTDQLLLALADPAQIASLSPYARDPALPISPIAPRRSRKTAAPARTSSSSMPISS